MAQYRQQFVVDRSQNIVGGSGGGGGEHVGIRIPGKHVTRIRRPSRPDKVSRSSAVAVFAVILCLGLLVTLIAFYRLSKHKEEEGEDSGLEFIPGRNQSISGKKLGFGHGSGATGGDSRYWDRDDRRRDQDYEEEDVIRLNVDKTDRIPKKKSDERPRGRNGGGLYNEGGRAELDSYKEEYENSLERRSDEEVSSEDEYDDGIDEQDEVEEEEENKKDANLVAKEKSSSSGTSRNADGGSVKGERSSGSGKKAGSKRKPKHHRFAGESFSYDQ